MEDSRWECVRSVDEGCNLYPRCIDCPLDRCKDDGNEWSHSRECKLAYIAYTLDKPSYVVATALEISIGYVNQLRRHYRESQTDAGGQRDTNGTGRDAHDQE